MKRNKTPLVTAAIALGLAGLPLATPAATASQNGTIAAGTLAYLSPAHQSAKAEAEAEGKCYPSGLCDGDDFSIPEEDYS